MENKELEEQEKEQEKKLVDYTLEDLTKIIQQEVDKFIIQKCTTELKEGEVLLVNYEVGDMAKEEVFATCSRLVDMFHDRGIKKLILTPTSNGRGCLTVNTVSKDVNVGAIK